MSDSDDPSLNDLLSVSNSDHDRLTARMDQARARMHAQAIVEEQIARRRRLSDSADNKRDVSSDDDSDTGDARSPQPRPQPPVTPNPPNHPAPPELPEDATDLIRARIESQREDLLEVNLRTPRNV